jgi:multidrug efflux pump subunit AcrB
MRVARQMATGIAMDDCIVIARSIAPPVAKRAVVTGIAAVAPGVIASFRTTAAVFLPLAFLSGDRGAVLEGLPVGLLAALAAALTAAVLIPPNPPKGGMTGTAPSRVRPRFDAGFAALRDHGAGRLAHAAIRAHWPVAGLPVGALFLTVGGSVVGRAEMPEIDGDALVARLLHPVGTPPVHTSEAVAPVEAALG